MKRVILNNWPYKLLALVVAFVTWFIVVQIADPQVTARFDVPITFVNEDVITSNGQVVTKYDATTITIRVTKPRSVINKLSEENFYIEADYSLMYRDSQVPVSVLSLVSEVSTSDIELEKQSVGVTIEKLVTVDKVVETASKGEPAAGYAVGTITPSPTSVTVICPESYASMIGTARAIVDVDKLSEDADIQAEIKFFGNKGDAIETEKIPGFAVTEGNIVTCHVELLQVQSVQIKVKATDTALVASGYAYTGASTDPATVSISGDKDVIADIKEIVIGDISVSGLSETTVKEVDIRSYIPDDVKVQGNTTTIKVTLNITKASEKSFEIAAADIKMTGLKDGYVARIVSGATVTIASSEEKLSTLSQDKILASVDLTNLSTGTHNVTLGIDFTEDGFTVKNNAEVKVVISG